MFIQEFQRAEAAAVLVVDHAINVIRVRQIDSTWRKAQSSVISG